MANVRVLASVALLTLTPAIPSLAVNETCLNNCQVDSDGLSFTKEFEGYSPFVYKDSGGVATVGFGHALQKGEHMKTPLMGPEAEKLLESDMQGKEKALNKLVKVPLRQEQFNALADFTYNVGEANLKKSTLLRKVNKSQHTEVPQEFLRWIYDAGREVEGLVLRRRAEARLYAEDK